MYDELLKRIHRQAVYLPEKFSKNAELLDVLMKAADAIEELSRLHEAQRQNLIALMNEEPEPKWIPCSERLPDYDEDVLVYANGLLRVWDRIKTLDDVDYWEDEYGYWVDFNDVDYWMPLPPSPEPPKEES